MQNRTELIWEALAPFVEERGLNDITQTLGCFDSHAENLLKDLKAALLSCNEQAASWRRKGEKGETAFIALSFLDTSILTGSYDLRIDFYDDNFLGDIAESCAYFPYVHLIPFYHESTEAICAMAVKRFIRLMDYERDAIAWKYKTEVLYKMVMTTCSLCLLHPEMAGFWPSLAVSENCVFTFGRLLDNQQLYLKMPRQKEVHVQ
ncbi:MAG: hypothetical protein LBH28_01925 [Oscillospiraceae bacterium]|jgi:hypothetical protein|nr:hypothetical protein [Oscillospiraceae bacterium]